MYKNYAHHLKAHALKSRKLYDALLERHFTNINQSSIANNHCYGSNSTDHTGKCVKILKLINNTFLIINTSFNSKVEPTFNLSVN